MRAPATATFLALTVIVLHGQILDRTTRQPLKGVSVDVYATGRGAAARSLAHGVTGADGRFRLGGLHRGTFRIDVSSDDVPQASDTLLIGSDHPKDLEIDACSTTLDYSCASAGGGGGG